MVSWCHTQVTAPPHCNLLHITLDPTNRIRKSQLTTDPIRYKRVFNRPPYTPEHKSTWHYSYTNTLTQGGP